MNQAGGSYADSLERFRQPGLAVYGTFVFGYDNDNAKTIQESVDFARQQKLFLAAFNHLIPFPGTPLYRRLKSEGRLLSDAWWLDPDGCVGDVNFQPKKMSPYQLQQACLGARRVFYSWSSIFSRMTDRKANIKNGLMAGVFLGLNLTSHFDIDLRQGLQLGAGMGQWEPIDEPISV
ncbi:MAG: DUF4070 domain-containing protein [Planctomycetales bacterium]